MGRSWGLTRARSALRRQLLGPGVVAGGRGTVSKVSQVTVCIELEKPAAAGLLGKGTLETKFKYQPFCILAA